MSAFGRIGVSFMQNSDSERCFQRVRRADPSDQSLVRRLADPPTPFPLMVRQILHSAPSRYDSRIADVSHQQVAEFFREIQIFLGEEIKALDRFLAQRRRILDVSLVHLEYGAIQRSHLTTPVYHFVHVLINDLHSLSLSLSQHSLFSRPRAGSKCEHRLPGRNLHKYRQTCCSHRTEVT